MIAYDIKIEGLDRIQHAFSRAPHHTMTQMAFAMKKSLVRLQSSAKEGAPVDQGTLRSSILIHPLQVTGTSIVGTVGTNLKYAEYQERGTGIYGPYGTPIRPKTKPMLAWKKGGKWHFAKEVKGSRPRYFMRGSLERNTSAVNGYFAQAADEIADALSGGAR